jgi:hypothetical protein
MTLISTPGLPEPRLEFLGPGMRALLFLILRTSRDREADIDDDARDERHMELASLEQPADLATGHRFTRRALAG